jgi:tetratricopeptide (TPR) repeat protein
VIDLQNGNYATAAQAFDRLSRLQPDNLRVRALLARSLASGGNALELAHRFDEAANTPYLATLVGRAHEKLGEREKAAAYLDRASRPLSGRPTPLPPATPLDVAQFRGVGQGTDALALVRGLLAAGQPVAARVRAQEFYRRFPGSSDAMGLAGDAALAAGDPRAALQLYARASRIRRPWPLVRRMAAAHVALGDLAGTDRLLADYLEGDPQNAEAAALLARSAYMRGEYARSARLLDHALALGAARDPVLHALRSELAIQQGDQQLAATQARRAYALQPSNPAAARMRWATAGHGAALARK